MKKYFYITALLLFVADNVPISYIGAAPTEHKHKFFKKIDSTGNLHKVSPKKEFLDPVRGPDIMSDCAQYGISSGNKEACERLKDFTPENNANSASVNPFKVANKMKQKKHPLTLAENIAEELKILEKLEIFVERLNV